MKRMVYILVVVAVMTGTAQAQWGNWGQQQNAADIIRATGEASSSVLAVIQNGKSQELAEREQRFQHEQARAKQQYQEVHYSQIQNTAQGQRIVQIRAEQAEAQNGVMRDALSASLQREEILVKKINSLDQENNELRQRIASLENTLQEILRRLPPAQQ